MHINFADEDLILIFIKEIKFIIIMINNYINFTVICLLNKKSDLKEVL